MSLKKYSVLSLLFLMPALCQAQNTSQKSFNPQRAEYLWPTNASHYLTSTFAETRAGHFHSALDLKTWGRKGYKVFATRDGILHRIAIGPTGYGKVIYLKHDDGSYSVYAHLLKFEKNIQQLADSIRFQNYSFELDQVVDSLHIKIRQGDLIGLSGASGIGPPHLHFELRTPNHEPFNPLLTNLSIKDTVPPQFSHLSVEPLSIQSRIEGKNQIFTKRDWKENGAYTFGIIDIQGPVGLGVDVFDQANDVSNAYAVYELKLFVDDSLFFYSKVDSFSYDKTHQMLVDRVYPLLQKYNAGYQRLYTVQGNTLPFYDSIKSAGKLELKPGDHTIKIIANDYYGNKSQATATLRVSAASKQRKRVPLNKETAKKTTALDPNQWMWFDDWVNIPPEIATNLTTTASDSAMIWQDDQSLSINLELRGKIFFRGSSGQYFTARRVPADSISFLSPNADHSFTRFEKGTFYDSISAGLFIQHLKPDSIKADVFPVTQPIQQPFTLAVALDSVQQALSKLSIYSYNEPKQKLTYLQSQVKHEYIFAKPEQLGTFFVLRDTTPPVLQNPSLHKREDGQWLVYVEATDNLSGINFKTATFTVNEIQGIAEFEPEDDRLVYYHPEFEPTSELKVALSVQDMEGNKTNKSFVIKP